MAGANYMGGKRNVARARSKDWVGRAEKAHFGKRRIEILHNALAGRAPRSAPGAVRRENSSSAIDLEHAARDLESAGPSHHLLVDRQPAREAADSSHVGLDVPEAIHSSSPQRARPSKVLEALNEATGSAYRTAIDEILHASHTFGLCNIRGSYAGPRPGNPMSHREPSSVRGSSSDGYPSSDQPAQPGSSSGNREHTSDQRAVSSLIADENDIGTVSSLSLDARRDSGYAEDSSDPDDADHFAYRLVPRDTHSWTRPRHEPTPDEVREQSAMDLPPAFLDQSSQQPSSVSPAVGWPGLTSHTPWHTGKLSNSFALDRHPREDLGSSLWRSKDTSTHPRITPATPPTLISPDQRYSSGRNDGGASPLFAMAARPLSSGNVVLLGDILQEQDPWDAVGRMLGLKASHNNAAEPTNLPAEQDGGRHGVGWQPGVPPVECPLPSPSPLPVSYLDGATFDIEELFGDMDMANATVTPSPEPSIISAATVTVPSKLPASAPVSLIARASIAEEDLKSSPKSSVTTAFPFLDHFATRHGQSSLPLVADFDLDTLFADVMPELVSRPSLHQPAYFSSQPPPENMETLAGPRLFLDNSDMEEQEG